MTKREQALELRNRAFALREDQEMERAYALISEAAQQLSDDPQTLFARAQMAFETGRPAIEFFDAALGLNADNPAFIRNRAAAYAAQGHVETAISQLEATLSNAPEWLDGHRFLARLHVACGDPEPARSYARAVQERPASLSIWLAWFQLLSTARQWDAARAVLETAELQVGPRPAFALARAYLSSESGEAADDPELFDTLSDIRDPGLDLCQTRHWLRLGDPHKAQTIAARNLGSPAETGFWPYLSLAWRQLGDSRAEWLDRPDAFIRSFDLDFTSNALNEIAATLRTLHTARAPFLEQSVRGGTQTDDNLFLRHEPAIQHVRARVQDAVRHYIDALPATETGHPLLSMRRERILFEGSWSVRLAAQGFHSCHTHPMGWISSALYIAVPKADDLGAPPAGWIALGNAPPELAIDVKPYAQIEPKAARLVLFPSTMWHGTMPFEGSERLTIAFDIRRCPQNNR